MNILALYAALALGAFFGYWLASRLHHLAVSEAFDAGREFQTEQFVRELAALDPDYQGQLDAAREGRN